MIFRERSIVRRAGLTLLLALFVSSNTAAASEFDLREVSRKGRCAGLLGFLVCSVSAFLSVDEHDAGEVR